ncbi:MAG TPA: ABC transporter ATP-binding protein [Acidimicrobiia bacterium]|nr:ABC transporter ATP-binding protein [Acidimicrobiia bacterium]
MSAAIVVENLRKSYGTTVALDGLSFQVAAGTLTGFLGPNGAGKTTTFRVLLGLTRPDAGDLSVLGMKVGPENPAIVRRLGAVVEEPGLVKGLNGRDNLRVAALTLGRGRERIDELLEFVGLAHDARRRIDGYSKGMKQRLALAAALLGDPELLFLDEPLDGLDPAGQAQIKLLLRGLAASGKTVMVSSHNLGDVEALADNVVVINRGKLVHSGRLADLLRSGPSGFRIRITPIEEATRVLAAAGFQPVPDGQTIFVPGDDGAAVTRSLAEAGLYVSELTPQVARLEDVFLQLTSGPTG